MEASSVSHGEEAELIRRCQAGETAAFDALVLVHQQQVFAVALRMLGEYHEATEVAQEAFVRAYRSIGSFRSEAKFSTWLFTIVTNLCRNRRRWWARRRRVIAASLDEPMTGEEGSLAHEVADPTPGPAANAQQAELSRCLTDALGVLDEDSRAVVVLCDVQGFSYEEAAQVLRVRLGTVKSRLSRARLKLRAMLDGKI
jgi:RNA polymerase sigma-70 factor (ECF subfamily)